MADSSDVSALDIARASAVKADEMRTKAQFGAAATEGDAVASSWALISIAESLKQLATEGIEVYELDPDGHRRYR